MTSDYKDAVGGEEYIKKQKILDEANKFINNPNVKLFYEGALTQQQRESEVPVGKSKGKPTYRMYRCICEICGKTSFKLPHSKTLEWAYEHNKSTNHAPIRQEGGIFFKEDLYK